MAGKKADQDARGVGRPPRHGAKLEPLLFRVPATIREAVDVLAAEAGVSRNDTLLLALVQWLAAHPTAKHVREAVDLLDLAQPKRGKTKA